MELYFSLPPAAIPPVELIGVSFLQDSLLATVVGFTLTFSMAKQFANKKNYKVDGRQELYAFVSKVKIQNISEYKNTPKNRRENINIE